MHSFDVNHTTDLSTTHATDVHRVAVLGATGSIGTAAAEVLASLNRVDPENRWQMWAASGHHHLAPLVELADAADPKPERLVFSCPQAAEAFLDSNDASRRYKIGVGADALVEIASCDEVDTLVAAIVGRAGLESTLAAIQAGKRVALANKETMVVAGPLVQRAMAESGAELLPVDSEHSAIFQALGDWASATARSPSESAESSPSPAKPRKLILTASGGPFRTWCKDKIAAATPKSALAHPTWKMGAKTTIDSATMMNKALEVIEARWLFDIPADQIEVVVHPQSIIHSMVEYDDGSLIAQMSPPDMRLPYSVCSDLPAAAALSRSIA